MGPDKACTQPSNLEAAAIALKSLGTIESTEQAKELSISPPKMVKLNNDQPVSHKRDQQRKKKRVEDLRSAGA